MPTPFDKFGYTDAAQTISLANSRTVVVGLSLVPSIRGGIADSSAQGRAGGTNTLAMIRAMLDGDMWLDGMGWTGPRPQPTEAGYSETMALLQQGFVSANVLADVIDRHVAGVIGNEPQWGLVPRRSLKKDEAPTAAEQTLIDEGEAFFTEWWDGRKVHTILRTAVRTLLMARRSPVRLYVPRGKLRSMNVADESGRAKTVRVVPTAEGDTAGGLAVVWPDHPTPENAAVVEDPDTKESLAVVLFKQGQTVTGTGGSVDVAELAYLTDTRDTTGRPITMIRQSATGTAAAAGDGARPAPIDRGVAMLRLGGRLPVYEMSREPFVTAQMIQQQRALNLAMSALPRNVITSGWLERVISNAQMPGKWIGDAGSRGGRRWVPDKHTTGAGATTYLKGLRQEDASTAAFTYSTPTVTYRDPSPVAPTVEGQEALYRAILREAKQEHVLMSQDIKASGKSREQARADFEMTLRPTAAEVNACGRWLIETTIAMAEEFANVPGKFTAGLRAHFECQLDTGPISDTERAALDASYKAGTLSLETTMAAQGVADPKAEVAKILAQPGASLGIAERQLTAVAAAATSGLDIAGAGRLTGLSAADADSLVPEFSDVPTDPNADAGGSGAAGGSGGDAGGSSSTPPAGRKKSAGTPTDPSPTPTSGATGGTNGARS